MDNQNTQNSPQQPVAPVKPTAQTSPASKTILIVEDDPLLVTMYTTKFKKEGFHVLSASDGEAGLKLATENKVDFMILDVMMPKLSGIDMLTRLRQTPSGKATPTIVLTNLSDQAENERIKNLGVKEYLVKANLTPSEVVGKVKKYLGTV